MKRKKIRIMGPPGWIWICVCLGGCLAGAGGHSLGHTDAKDPRAAENVVQQWEVGVEMGGADGDTLHSRRLLSTNNTGETTAAPAEGDKSIWEEIEEFYSDNNNMAMFCVLPLIVLIYGGCSAIYCVYKCRRYLRRRGKHKRLHNEDSNSVSEDERNDLNQEGEGTGQPIKTVSATTWGDKSATFNDVNYNLERKKTPLPWDSPGKSNQRLQRRDSLGVTEQARSRDGNYSTASGDSSSLALEREREKLDRGVGVKGGALSVAAAAEERSTTLPTPTEPLPPRRPPPSTTLKPTPHNPAPVAARPLEIVPISQKEYERHMESSGIWDPLHNRPFDSRASGAETERSRQGRESSWSIRDEIMAKYDALTSLAMAKKTADVLRSSSYDDNLDNGHRPDTLRRKPGKKKLIFIAE